jgi:hypothetical protein
MSMSYSREEVALLQAIRDDFANSSLSLNSLLTEGARFWAHEIASHRLLRKADRKEERRAQFPFCTSFLEFLFVVPPDSSNSPTLATLAELRKDPEYNKVPTLIANTIGLCLAQLSSGRYIFVLFIARVNLSNSPSPISPSAFSPGDLLARLNQLRQKTNLPPFTPSPPLQEFADEFCRRLAGPTKEGLDDYSKRLEGYAATGGSYVLQLPSGGDLLASCLEHPSFRDFLLSPDTLVGLATGSDSPQSLFLFIVTQPEGWRDQFDNGESIVDDDELWHGAVGGADASVKKASGQAGGLAQFAEGDAEDWDD